MIPEDFQRLMEDATRTAAAAIGSDSEVVIVVALATHAESGKVLHLITHRPGTEVMATMAEAAREALKTREYKKALFLAGKARLHIKKA